MPRALLLVVAAAAAFAGWQVATWPEVSRLAGENPTSTAFIERYRARAAADGGPEPEWRWVGYEAIADDLKLAVLVAEDIDFFSHRGFAAGELRTAVSDAWRERTLPRGASTLSQQLVKNLWLSSSRDPWRKVKEALLTRQLERAVGKRRILELYLNVVELGPGVYGAEAASRRYFGRPARALSRRQAAELAASLPRPASWHPGSDSPSYRSYVQRIEARAEKASWLRREL